MNAQEIEASITQSAALTDVQVVPFDREAALGKIKDLTGKTFFGVFLAEPWESLKRASDYYDFLHQPEPDRQFQLLHSVSEVIREMAMETRSLSVPNFTFMELSENTWHVETVQGHRDTIAHDKMHAENRVIPFTPYEMFLYHSITQGGESWPLVASFYQNITDAMRINPRSTMPLMQIFGLDMILPNYPTIETEHLEELETLTGKWDGNQDGIEFFAGVMKHIGKHPNTDNTPETYWAKAIQVLTHLERYVDYFPAERTNQKPEYYMEICRALAYFPLHRKLQFDEMQEAVSALVVREGKILGASYNIPTDRPHFHEHAEQVAIKKAVKASGDPFLAGASLYINIEPCIECGPIIRKYDFSELYFGPRTLMGADTRSGLFTVQDTTEEIPSGDFLKEQGEPYFPIPSVVVFNMFYDEMVELIVNGQKWKRFILPIQNK